MKLLVTDHAVERYIDRVDPSLQFWEARQVLELLWDSGPSRLDPTPGGEERWHLKGVDHHRPCVAVVKRDRNVIVIATVLGPKELKGYDAELLPVAKEDTGGIPIPIGMVEDDAPIPDPRGDRIRELESEVARLSSELASLRAQGPRVVVERVTVTVDRPVVIDEHVRALVDFAVRRADAGDGRAKNAIRGLPADVIDAVRRGRAA